VNEDRHVEEEAQVFGSSVQHLRLRRIEFAYETKVDRRQLTATTDRIRGQVLPKGLAFLMVFGKPVTGLRWSQRGRQAAQLLLYGKIFALDVIHHWFTLSPGARV